MKVQEPTRAMRGLESANRVASSPAVAALVYSFRLPKPGTVDPFFGGARTFWNSLVLVGPNGERPPVKSVVRKVPGAKRGCRFILFSSAKTFFETLEAEQWDGNTPKGDAIPARDEAKG